MRKLLFALLAFVFATAAQAQFADQRQYAPATTGSANAQIVSIPNYALNPGVAIRFRASFSNSGALTINVNGTGAVPVMKQTATGLAALSGGEVVAGQIAEVFFDGAQYELLNTANASYAFAGTSGGSANAQTLTAPAPFTGQQITFIAGFSNTNAMTLNGIAVDRDTIAGPVPLIGGEVHVGNIVSVAYDNVLALYHLVTYISPSQFYNVLASAATTDLGTSHSPNVTISGTTTITSFGSSAAVTAPIYRVGFSGSLLLTHNGTSLILPGATSITTQAGDSLVAQYLGSGNWRVLSYNVATIPPIPRAAQVTVYAASATGTYTTPTGAIELDVEMCGAGSGGGGAGTTSTGGNGGAGTASTFGASLTANGGAATPLSGATALATAATASGGDANLSGALGQAGSYVNGTNWYGGGGMGASSYYGGGASGGWITAAGSVGAAASAHAPCAGGGGGVPNASGVSANPGFGGNAGAFLTKVISSPAATYAYTVGAAGTGGTAGTSGSAGGNGSDGFIKVTAKFQ